MTKIKAIPDIPQKILDAAKREDLVVFFGAGVSQIIGCPNWQGFAKAYLDKALDKKIINHFEYEQLSKKDPRMALTICQKILEEAGEKPPDPGEILKGVTEKIEKHKIYDHLYDMHAIFVTTNFDNHMDSVIVKNRPVPSAPPMMANLTEAEKVAEQATVPQDIFYAENDLLVTTLRKGSLIHIHGSIVAPNDLVVTLPDYISKYQPGTNHHVLLRDIFDKKTVLFMGYGLEEYDIIEFLVKKSNVVSGEIRHYMLQAAFKEEGNMMELYGKYYSTLGIELLPYSKTNPI
jgi:NAD-dependent SIR2 family protein deacetylase